jgi:tetratricopeptide (TPR) repeat protein
MLQWARTYPHEIAPHLDLGNVYAAMGQHQKQLDEQQAALRIDPDSSFVYHNLVQAYFSLNQVDQAERALHEAQRHKVPRWASVDLLYSLAFLRGDTKAMEQQIATATGQPEFEEILPRPIPRPITDVWRQLGNTTARRLLRPARMAT